MSMNLTQLATLRELYRLGTMAAVGKELGYTAGAISQQITSLEKSVGVSLVARHGRNVVLTDAGVVLAGRADELLDIEQRVREATRLASAAVSAPVVVGTFGSSAVELLPKVVSRAARQFPNMALRSRELDVDGAVEAVERRTVDLAFGLDYSNAPLPVSDDIEVITLRSERFELAVSPGLYGVRTEGTIDLSEAADWNWILPGEATRFGGSLYSACRSAGFEPVVRHQIDDTSVSLALVAAGLGVTFVTKMMARLNPSAPIIRLSLAESPSRRIVLVRLAGSDIRPTVRAVTDMVRDVA